MNIRTTLTTAGLAAGLTLGAVGTLGVSPAGAATEPTEPAGEAAATFCAELDAHRAEADARLAELQGRIDGAQERLTERLAWATEAGRAPTVAVIEARLARIASAEVELPARVAAAFERAEEACAARPAP